MMDFEGFWTIVRVEAMKQELTNAMESALQNVVGGIQAAPFYVVDFRVGPLPWRTAR